MSVKKKNLPKNDYFNERDSREVIGVSWETMRNWRKGDAHAAGWRYRSHGESKNGKVIRSKVQWSLSYVNEHFFQRA